MEDEREATFRHLRQDRTPPAELKSRIRRDLSGRGLIRRREWSRVSGGLAAGLVALTLFGGGLVLGRRSTGTAAESGPRFVLLLYDPAGFDRTVPEPTLVEEYRSWAHSLGDRLALGEKLGAEERLLGQDHAAAAGAAGPLGGLFIIRARNLEEAMKIARSCPHLKHGGVIAVRAIEET
jgi:hypothetical protein